MEQVSLVSACRRATRWAGGFSWELGKTIPALFAALQGVELGLRCMAAAGAGTVMTMLNSPAGRFAFAEAAAGAASVAASAGAGQSAAASSSVAGKQQAAGRVAAAGQEQEEAHAGGSDGSQPGSGGGGAGFESFLGRVVQTGAVPLQMPLFSAHQMGTCRLGEPWVTARWQLPGCAGAVCGGGLLCQWQAPLLASPLHAQPPCLHVLTGVQAPTLRLLCWTRAASAGRRRGCTAATAAPSPPPPASIR